jgi:hypothetical protein
MAPKSNRNQIVKTGHNNSTAQGTFPRRTNVPQGYNIYAVGRDCIPSGVGSSGSKPQRRNVGKIRFRRMATGTTTKILLSVCVVL